MNLATNERVGIYSILVAFVALFVQRTPNSNSGLILSIALAQLAAMWPILSILPARWRGEVPMDAFIRLAKASSGPLVLAGLVAAFVHGRINIPPSTGIILASAGVANIALFLLLLPQMSFPLPAKWSWLTAGAHFTVAFMHAFYTVEPGVLVSMAVLYGAYGLAVHYCVFVALGQNTNVGANGI